MAEDEQSVTTRQDGIEIAAIDRLAGAPSGVQVRPVAEFAALIEPGGLMQRPHRTDFHAFALIHSGSVTHKVDFTDYELKAGDLLWTRPGQIHHFSDPAHYDATAVTLRRGFVSRATATAAGRHIQHQPPVLRPDHEELTQLEGSLARLRHEYLDTTTLPAGVRNDVLRHCVSMFLLRAAEVARRSEGVKSDLPRFVIARSWY
ncbi:AraC family ligand binding domain-containing protein [Streptomyces sp. IBSNAI002]|uniref:AraC family ligand binding domain-containing protein n=1 Tax=Streptomyces sp. IBSNAI002 TaxID=3457500 RepID=UPI003FD3882D